MIAGSLREGGNTPSAGAPTQVDPSDTDDSVPDQRQEGLRTEGRLKLQLAMERVTQSMVTLTDVLNKRSERAAAITHESKRNGKLKAEVAPKAMHGGLASSNDLELITMQTLTNQRQQAIQLITELAGSMDQAAKAIAKKIGEGAGRCCIPTPIPTAAFVDELYLAC